MSGGYLVRSANNRNCVLDMQSSQNGGKIRIYNYKAGNRNQIWQVEKYNPPAKNQPSKLNIAPRLGKTTIYAGSMNGVSGSVTSNYKITQVTGEIVGTRYKKTVYPNATYYSLTGSIDNAMLFNKLSGGKTYTFKVTAKDASGKTLSKSINCAVKKSSLSVGPKLGRTTITQGSTNGVSGSVASNKKITRVTAQIIGKSNKKVYYSKTVKPNRTSYKLTGTIDNTMKFNKLGRGTYVFKVTAWDVSGNVVSKSINCTVKAKSSSSKKNVNNASTKKLGVPYYSQDSKSWNRVKIGKSNSYIGMVNGTPGYGCLLTDVAIVERYVRRNKSITPITIAKAKNQFKGDLFRWDTGYGRNYATTSRSLTNIYNNITKGKTVLASVYRKGEGQHWVVIYGYTGVKLNKAKNPISLKFSNFLIRDPGWKSRTKLSSYSVIKNAKVRR